MELRDQLQNTLGDAYTLERELGGGGMSRVFVAEERALGRKVVVKVLPPTLSGGVNIDRFKREIQVAARLQHAHIVPVLTAGDTDGLPYYTMPFVEGESLRARLVRDGALPITEAISILRDVARALTYAHERGVVHRDIKPDNVMLSGGSAVVTDFGIAKAISASRTADDNATLTQVGTALGTPAYMAPEQAAGDPSADHRADLYALGCMAYEMLVGQPPFVEKTPQQLLAAHMAKTPEPTAARRVDTPPALDALITRCLEKDAENRPATAAEVARTLESVTSGGTHPTMPPILLASPGAMKRALLLYAGAFVIVSILAKAAIVGIGLPDWVFPGALIVMALGLPVILFTGYVQRVTHRALTMTPTYTPGGNPSMGAQGTLATMAMKASPHVSWTRTARGGAIALGGFVVVVAGFMVMRAFGIGPAASLIGSGKFSASDQILVADFKASGGDTVLSAPLAEAMRSSLAQSRAVRVVQASAIAAALRRMARPVDARVDEKLAAELATREGFKAVVTGDVAAVSGGYLVTVKLVSGASGDVLASFQQSAKDATELIPAMDQAGRKLRAKIGESLKAVQNAPALAKVTTPSLEALRKYTEGGRANDVEVQYAKSAKLLDEAIALDSNFAMAYRKLALAISNGGGPGSGPRAAQVLDRAYARRDRFGEAERLLLDAEYYRRGSHQDRTRAIATYEEIGRRFPEWGWQIANNFALTLNSRQEFAKAESLYKVVMREQPEVTFPYANIIISQIAMGKTREALASARALRTVPQRAADADRYEARVFYNAGFVDSATTAFAAPLAKKDSARSILANRDLASLALREGRIRDWRRYRAAANAGGPPDGDGFLAADSLQAAAIAFWILGQPAEASRLLDATVAHTPPAQRTAPDVLMDAYVLLGRVRETRAVMALVDSTLTDTARRRFLAPLLHALKSGVAFAAGNYADAAKESRAADRLPDGPANACAMCNDFRAALAFDRGGQADSAISVYEHFLKTPYLDRLTQDEEVLAWTYRRLGELYDTKNQSPSAIGYYQKFVDLWKNADPELQPQVTKVRTRLQQLLDSERRKG